jgi:hypothetical protein
MNKAGFFKLPDYLVTKPLRFKIKIYYIAGTIFNSIFYKEASAQKEMLTNFRKLGKVKILGRDEAQRIVIRLVFSPQATCVVLLYPYNGWLVEKDSIMGKGEKYFEKLNLPWYLGGNLGELKTAANRTDSDNLLLKL